MDGKMVRPHTQAQQGATARQCDSATVRQYIIQLYGRRTAVYDRIRTIVEQRMHSIPFCILYYRHSKQKQLRSCWHIRAGYESYWLDATGAFGDSEDYRCVNCCTDVEVHVIILRHDNAFLTAQVIEGKAKMGGRKRIVAGGKINDGYKRE